MLMESLATKPYEMSQREAEDRISVQINRGGSLKLLATAKDKKKKESIVTS